MASRMDLGFGDAASAEGDALDLSAFAPRRARVDAPALETARRAAEATGFRSREPVRGVAREVQGEGEGPSAAAPSVPDQTPTSASDGSSMSKVASKVASDAAGKTTGRPAGRGEGKVRKAPVAKPAGTMAESDVSVPAPAPASATTPAPAASAPETAATTAYGRPPRRRRTGRNVQFNIKARPETIKAFTAIADANDWGFGETLEHAVALLEAAQGEA